jgi:rhamnosyl/mannosyltransferase
MHVLHAYKVCHAEIYGGIPEVIRMLASSRKRGVTSGVLAARMRGWGRHLTSGTSPIKLTGSFGTLASTPITPSYPFALMREAKRADVLALHSPFPLNDIGVRLGIPQRTALVVHWHAEVLGRPMLSRAFAGLFRTTLCRADRIVVSSERLLEGSEALAPHLHKCSVIPFGVDTAFWGTPGDNMSAEVKRLSSAQPRLVLAVGRLVSYKGFDVLIEALRDLDATAIIVGDGIQASRLRRLVKDRGLTDRVFLPGSVSRQRLRMLMHAARVFVFPSVTAAETFGIAQLEAMAAGLPIINTALPSGVPTVARHGIEALTVPPGDPAPLADAIRCLLDSPELAAGLGRAGKKRAAAESTCASSSIARTPSMPTASRTAAGASKPCRPDRRARA